MHLHWNVDDQVNNSGTECKMQQTSTHVSIECQGTACDHLTSMNYVASMTTTYISQAASSLRTLWAKSWQFCTLIS